MTADPAALARVHAAAFPESRGWSATEIAKLISHHTTLCLGDDRAFLLGRIVGDEAEILTIATSPDHRRKGHAKRLLSNFFKIASERGVTSAFLEVAADNRPARALYETSGFEEVGLRAAYYARPSDPPVDALLLRRALDTDPSPKG